MLNEQHITALIPAFNEEKAIGRVLDELLSIQVNQRPLFDNIIVVNNNSTDKTAEIATRAGVSVVFEAKPGYGSACYAGFKSIKKTDIVLFVDGDHSNSADDILKVCNALSPNLDLVVGSRTLGVIEKNAMTKTQYFGTRLICWLIRLRFNTKVTDLGPLRAIRYNTLELLDMVDRRFGWTAEMQIKVIKNGFQLLEIPVTIKPRIGQSKISGTWRGTFLAGIDLLKHTLTT